VGFEKMPLKVKNHKNIGFEFMGPEDSFSLHEILLDFIPGFVFKNHKEFCGKPMNIALVHAAEPKIMEPPFVKSMGIEPPGIVGGIDFKGTLPGFPGKRLDNSSNTGVNKGPENLIQGFLTAGNPLTVQAFFNTFMNVIGVSPWINDIFLRTVSQIQQVPASETASVKKGLPDHIMGFSSLEKPSQVQRGISLLHRVIVLMKFLTDPLICSTISLDLDEKSL
jgi:hypothetical protein